MSNQQILFILGMHRSGTSALTRLVNLCGVSLGTKLLPPQEDNITGFWEHEEFKEVHDQILTELGRNWQDIRPMPDNWLDHPSKPQWKQKIAYILDHDFDNSAIIAIKDPRMCRLLPLWQEVLEERQTTGKVIQIFRMPDEVAGSLKKRNKFGNGHSYLLWLLYHLEAEKFSRHMPRAFIEYEDLLADPIVSLDKIASQIQLTWPHKPKTVKKEIQEFIIPDLRHHETKSLAKDPQIQSWIKDCLKALRASKTKDNQSKVFDGIWEEAEPILSCFEDAMVEEKRFADDQQQVLKNDNLFREREIQRLEGRINILTQQIHAFESSLSFRLTQPIRKWGRLWRRYSLYLPRPKHRITLNPVCDIEVKKDGYYSTGEDPQFILQSHRRKMPRGWVIMSFNMTSDRPFNVYELFYNEGGGYSSTAMIRIPQKLSSRQRHLIRLPERVTGLRFDPMDTKGQFTLSDFTIKELSTLMVYVRFVWWRVKYMLRHPALFVYAFCNLLRIYRNYGWRGVQERLMDKAQENSIASSYPTWIKLYSSFSEKDRRAIEKRIATLTHKPLISVIMPTYNTPPQYLKLAIESVRRQIYPHWELCIADDASTLPQTLQMLKEYEALDPRIKITFRKKNGHISAASNTALELAKGEFIALFDHDDELTEHALYMMAEEINSYPDVDMIYSDEDKMDENRGRFGPHFKPSYNPDLMYCQNYITHFTVIRNSLVQKIGGFRLGFEGSQDYDLFLRVMENTDAAHIRHIPQILYHWRAIQGSTALSVDQKSYAVEASRRALKDHFQRQGIDVEVTAAPDLTIHHRVIFPVPQPQPLVSIIIPTRDQAFILKKCLEGILNKTAYQNFEVLIIDNGSQESETLQYFEALKKHKNIRILSQDIPFNYSKLNNYAVSQAKGDLICLMNNDVEPISEDWLREMVSHALRPDIGIVGAKLYYSDRSLQHAGVILTEDVTAKHLFKHLSYANWGYFGRSKLPQNFLAVTAACMLMRKEVFLEVGGLDEDNLAIAFNDVDLCLKVHEKGLRILYTPYAELYHHESISRGGEDSFSKLKRFHKEIAFIHEKWRHYFQNDPYLNANLNITHHNYVLAFPPRGERPWNDCY